MSPHVRDGSSSGSEDFDIVIVGAGVSGINTAYSLKNQLPGVKFVIFEGRDDISGTWDLFKYPGIRSDSDLYTYVFSWHPWPNADLIGKGPEIKEYIKDAVATHGIDQYIHLRHKVLALSWSSATRHWTVTVSHNDTITEVTARFIVLGSGYYDYDTPAPGWKEIPGLDEFQGDKLHPQFWPENYDHTGKRMAIIGSGATAIGMFPELAKKTSELTLVQRSPTYVLSSQHLPPGFSALQPYLPWQLPILQKLDRPLFALTTRLTILFCEWFPSQARALLRALAISQLPENIDHDTHFKPQYSPWQQRLCLTPDGDFFKALHKPHTNIVTGTIQRVTKDSILMKDGAEIKVDAIVTATGLTMRSTGGHIKIAVDGQEVKAGGRFIWNGCMLEGIPNLTMVVGYSNSAWTIGADAATGILLRLLKHMRKNDIAVATPKIPGKGFTKTYPLFELSSTYIAAAEAESRLPIYGNEGPWKPKRSALADHVHATWGDVTTGLVFSPSK